MELDAVGRLPPSLKLQRTGKSPFHNKRYRFWAWIITSLAFFSLSLRQPFGIFGDGLEYVVQTQSFVFDHSLSIDTTRRADYWNRTNPFQVSLTAPGTQPKITSNLQLRERSQAGGGFGSLYPGRDGRFYYIHSWIYSLAVSPVYYSLHLVSRIDGVRKNLEYFSFQLFNSLLLAGVFCFSIESVFGIGIIFFLILSPLSGYLSWTTPEVFQFSVLAIAFSQAKHSKILSPLLVGIAAAQNFPALVFFLPLLLLQTQSLSFETLVKQIRVYILAALIGLFPWLIYQLKFGTPNLIVSVGQANLSYCSLSRLKSFLFSPIAGVLWFYPVLVLLIPILFIQREAMLGRVTLLIFTLILCLTMTGMVNFHSQQIGCVRYAAWILAPIAGLLLSGSLNKSFQFKLWNIFGTAGALLVTYFYQNWTFATGNHSRTNYLSVLPTQAARLYHILEFEEEPELLVEVARQRELVSPWEFDARYEIPIQENEALCLVSLRSVKNGTTRFIPNESICSSLSVPDPNSVSWKRSSVLGGYYLKKVSKL